MPATSPTERSLYQTVAVLCRVMEARDAWTAGHLARVSALARRIAEGLGLTAHEVDGIRIAANLHDIGKMAIPAEILLHPGRLTPEQTSLIRTHSRVGADLLCDVDFPWPVGDAVRQHHERLDGTGYPDGLAGDAISLGGRIIAVADVVDAMVSHRGYRRTPGLDRALIELREGSGLRYDPDVTTKCVALLTDPGFLRDHDAAWRSPSR